MRTAWIAAATIVALAVQTTLARFLGGTIVIDLVLVVVVYAALSAGPVAGLLTGTFAGLAQEALSIGVIGIGGLAKTIVGFVAGVMYLMHYGVVSFYDGFVPGIKAFTAAVLGGIGSLPGAVIDQMINCL